MMDIQKPAYIDADFCVVGENTSPMSAAAGATLGAADQVGACPQPNPWVFAIIGAVVMYAAPPFVSGIINGMRDGWDERD